MEGYIKLHRQILESNVFANQTSLKLWLWCLLKANYRDRFLSIKVGKGESVIKVKRGSFLFGRFAAEEELNISGSSIYRTIQNFEKEGMLTIESGNQFSIISIVKYEDFQQFEDENTTSEQPMNNPKMAIIEPDSNISDLKKDNLNSEWTADEPDMNYIRTRHELHLNTTNKANKDKKDKNYKSMFLSEISISDFTYKDFYYVEIARSFQLLFIKNLSEAGAATAAVEKAKGTWADDVRLMIETDKYSVEDLRQVYELLQHNNFWKKNILSTSKLREKMSNLKLEIKNGTNRKTGNSKPSAEKLERLSGIVHKHFGSQD